MNGCDDITPWVSYVIPVIAYRFARNGKSNAGNEESEDVRCALAQIVVCVVFRTMHMPQTLLEHLHHISSILEDCMADEFSDVKVVGLVGASILGQILPQQMRAHSHRMVPTIAKETIHRHARVRSAAVDALRYIIPCGAAEAIRELAAFRESNVIDMNAFYHGETRVNYFAKLVGDGNNRVRRKYYDMLSDWMTNLPERYDYETLMMPYLLSGLFDATNEIQQKCLETVNSIGAEYERNNEDKLKDQMDYGERAELLTKPYLHSLSEFLPQPFTARPSIGVREVMYRFLPRLIPAIITELSDWKEDTRVRSLSLLRVMLVFGEDSVTKYGPALMDAFIKMGSNKEFELLRNDCLRLFFRYAAADVSIPLLVDLGARSSEMTASSLEILAIVLDAIPESAAISQVCKVFGLLMNEESVSIASDTQTVLTKAKIAVKLSKLAGSGGERVVVPTVGVLCNLEANLVHASKRSASLCELNPIEETLEQCRSNLAAASGCTEEQLYSRFSYVVLDCLSGLPSYEWTSSRLYIYTLVSFAERLVSGGCVDTDALEQLVGQLQVTAHSTDPLGRALLPATLLHMAHSKSQEVIWKSEHTPAILTSISLVEESKEVSTSCQSAMPIVDEDELESIECSSAFIAIQREVIAIVSLMTTSSTAGRDLRDTGLRVCVAAVEYCSEQVQGIIIKSEEEEQLLGGLKQLLDDSLAAMSSMVTHEAVSNNQGALVTMAKVAVPLLAVPSSTGGAIDLLSSLFHVKVESPLEPQLVKELEYAVQAMGRLHSLSTTSAQTTKQIASCLKNSCHPKLVEGVVTSSCFSSLLPLVQTE